MDWYYAANGQQVGPVSETQLDELQRNGAIHGATLVWRSGLPDWQPLQNARPTSTPATPPSTASPAVTPGVGSASAPCAECPRVFPQSEMVFLNRSWACAQCKPIFIQRMKEGV